MWGMTRQEWEAEQVPYPLWPENSTQFDIWQLVGDQWIMGASGPVALNLIPVLHVIDNLGLDGDEKSSMLDDVKLMADSALKQIRESA